MSSSRRRTLVLWLTTALLLVGAFCVRRAFLHEIKQTAYADTRELLIDSTYYDMRAREIAAGDVLGDAPGFLSPVYCGALGLSYAVSGAEVKAAARWQALLGACSVVLLYWIGRRLFSQTVGVMSGVVFALYGLHIFYTGLLMPTVLVVFLNLAFLWLMISRTPLTTWRSLLAGVALGLAIGAKSNALLALPVAAVWLLWTSRPLALAGRLARVGALLLGTAAAVAPITIQNYLLSDSFILVHTAGGRNLLKGNGPDATGSHIYLPEEARGTSVGTYIVHKVDPGSVAAEDHADRRAAFAAMLDRPGHALALFWRKFRLMFHAEELGNNDQYAYAREQLPMLALPWFSFGLVVPFGLAALAALGLRRLGASAAPRSAMLLLLGLLAVQVASFVLVFVLGRYRLVAVACLIPLGCQLVCVGVEHARRRRWSALALVGGLLVVATGFVHAPVNGFSFDADLVKTHLFLGNYNMQDRRYDAALEHFRSALDDPQMARYAPVRRYGCLLRQARCEQLLGRSAEATETLSKLSDELSRVDEGEYSEMRAVVQQRLDELDDA